MIAYREKEPNLFSIFLFEISAEEQEKKSHMYQNCSVEGIQVLLVEDNELNMEIAEFLLKEEKMIVTKAWNGREAVEIFENSEPGYFDVILMDLMMPQMGGLEATRRIRKMDREDAKSIPIFAMTANAFLDDIAQSKAAGMNEHFFKTASDGESDRCDTSLLHSPVKNRFVFWQPV